MPGLDQGVLFFDRRTVKERLIVSLFWLNEYWYNSFHITEPTESCRDFFVRERHTRKFPPKKSKIVNSKLQNGLRTTSSVIVGHYWYATGVRKVWKLRFHSENSSIMLCVHATPEELKNAKTTGHFGLFCFWKQLGQENQVIWYLDASVSKSSGFFLFSKCFPSHTTLKSPVFSNSSGLKRVFEKLRFLGGLVWTADLTVKIKLRERFQIPSA